MTKSRKPKKSAKLSLVTPTGGSPSTNAAGVLEKPTGLRLSDVLARAGVMATLSNWEGLVQLGDTPLSHLQESDHVEAIVALPLLKIRGLTRGAYTLDPGHDYDLRIELGRLTCSVAILDEGFWRRPELRIFVEAMRPDFESNAQGFRHLARACLQTADLEFVSRLRSCALRMKDPHGYYDDLTADQAAIAASFRDVDLILSEAYGLVEQAEHLTDEARLIAKVYRLELETLQADPWDYRRVATQIRALPAPDLHTLRGWAGEDVLKEARHLLPTAWAFLWELSNAGAAELPDLVKRYEGHSLGNNTIEGVRHVLTSLVRPNDAEALLDEGAHLLMHSVIEQPNSPGESISLMLAGGAVMFPFSWASLNVPAPADILFQLWEKAPPDYPFEERLGALARVYDANARFSPIPADEANPGLSMPGLAWLCGTGTVAHFCAAYAVSGSASRMRLTLQAITQCAKAGVNPPESYYAGDLDPEGLTPEDVRAIHQDLKALAEVRPGMTEPLVKAWQKEIGRVFTAISKHEGELRKESLRLARTFAQDLAAHNAVRLGYLEDTEGCPVTALVWYCTELTSSDVYDEYILGRIKHLLTTCRDTESAALFVRELESELKDHRKASALQPLLKQAKAQLADCEKKDQYELTAVNRWPSLTAPARKLLSVLATIKSYRGFEELGEYAGMSEDWARRHYGKLVEQGMLKVTDTGYVINKHISPLLEREALHTVVGRIVRSQGTSAVKQVFNSQREYGIYQVMVQLCPNHLVFPNSSLQSIMSYDRMKELVEEADFGYYLRASVDLVVVSSTTYLPMLAIEVDSVWHDTERQQERDERKDRLFATAGIPFMRLQPVGSPSAEVVRAQVGEHLDELIRSLRDDLPGADQAKALLRDLAT